MFTSVFVEVTGQYVVVVKVVNVVVSFPQRASRPWAKAEVATANKEMKDAFMMMMFEVCALQIAKEDGWTIFTTQSNEGIK